MSLKNLNYFKLKLRENFVFEIKKTNTRNIVMKKTRTKMNKPQYCFFSIS